jgi:hypothetical protein
LIHFAVSQWSERLYMVVPATLVRKESGDASERACFELRSLTGPSTHMWCYHRLSYVKKGPATVREHTSHRVRNFPRVAHSLLPALLSPVCSSSATSHRKTHRKTRFFPSLRKQHTHPRLCTARLHLRNNGTQRRSRRQHQERRRR